MMSNSNEGLPNVCDMESLPSSTISFNLVFFFEFFTQNFDVIIEENGRDNS